MLNQFIEQQQAICAVFLENQDASQFMLSDDEISAAEELVEVLEVFHSATEIVSGEKYPTLGIILPFLHKLLSHTLAEAENDKRLTKRIKKAIRDDLTSRYQDDVVKKKFSIAMYLDPRFKAVPFLNDSVLLNVKLELIELVDADQQQQVPTEPEPSESPVKKRKLTKFFEGIIILPSDKAPLISPHEIVANELRKYEAEDPESLDSLEPLKWWKAREQQLKYLSRLAKRVLCVTASSVPSERLFSSAGNLVNEKKSCLLPESVDHLLFCMKT